MIIVDSVNDIANLPVIAWPEFLKNQTGAERVGYFVDGDMTLPFVIRKKAFLRWIQLYTAVVNCASPEQEKHFLNESMRIVKTKYRVSHVMTSNTSLFKSFPDGAEYCKWGTYKVDLSLEEEALFSNLHSKHRNVIRKAQTLGLIVQHGKEYAKDVVRLMNDTYNRQGAKFTYGDTYINNLNALGDNVDWWIVKDPEGTIQGSAIFLWNEGFSCYYLHGGSSAHTPTGAMNLLIWTAMLEMKSRGVRYFDFVGARLTTEEGSKLEGIQRFKSRFGSSLEVGYMFRYVVSPVRYVLYDFAMHIFYLLHGKTGSYDPIKQERKKGNY